MRNISLISSKRSRQFSAACSAVQTFAAKYSSYFVVKTLRDAVPFFSSRSPTCPGTSYVASRALFNLRGAWEFRLMPKKLQMLLIIPKRQEAVVAYSCLDWSPFKRPSLAYSALKQGSKT